MRTDTTEENMFNLFVFLYWELNKIKWNKHNSKTSMYFNIAVLEAALFTDEISSLLVTVLNFLKF